MPRQESEAKRTKCIHPQTMATTTVMTCKFDEHICSLPIYYNTNDYHTISKIKNSTCLKFASNAPQNRSSVDLISHIVFGHPSFLLLRNGLNKTTMTSWRPSFTKRYSPENYPKLTYPLKNAGRKTIFLLKWSLFRWHVDFSGGKFASSLKSPKWY